MTGHLKQHMTGHLKRWAMALLLRQKGQRPRTPRVQSEHRTWPQAVMQESTSRLRQMRHCQEVRRPSASCWASSASCMAVRQHN